MKNLILGLSTLLICANMTIVRAGNVAGLTNHLSAQEIVDQMRGLNMQWTEPRMDDGRINLEEQQKEEIIQELRSVGKDAIPALIHVLGDSDVQMRRNAALVIIELAGGYDGQAKMDIREAVPALIKATQDKDSDVRGWAAQALGEVGPNASEAVPALIKLLELDDPGSRNSACIALGDIGPAASAALPGLERALHDSNKDVRQFAGQAIKKIQGS